MAHELMQHDTMVSGNGIVPWHGLGQVVNGLMTSEEVLKLATELSKRGKDALYLLSGF